MTSRIKELRAHTEQLKGQLMQTRKNLQTETLEVRRKKRDLRQHEKAAEVVRIVGKRTQQQLAYHIGDITTLALESIFPNAYTVKAEFVERRNRNECDLFFERNGLQIEPLTGAGGGVVDVSSFSLRMASWSMQYPKLRNIIFLDEPFKHLSRHLLPLASEMIKQIAKKLGLQIIMITHSDDLTVSAHRGFSVGIKDGISFIS